MSPFHTPVGVPLEVATGAHQGNLCTTAMSVVIVMAGFACFFVKLYKFFFLDYILKNSV